MRVRFDTSFGAAQGVADLIVLDMGAWSSLLAVERLGGGIHSYDLNSLAQQDDRAHQGAVLGTGQGAVLAGETPRLLLAGSAGSQVHSHVVARNGDIARQDSWALPGTGDLDVLTSVRIGGQDLLYGWSGGRLGGWRIEEGGRLQAVAQNGAGSPYHTAEGTGVQVVSAGASSFLVAAYRDANGLGGLRSYAINAATGALTPQDQLDGADGWGVSLPSTLEMVTAYGRAWLFVGAAGSSSLSVVAVSGSGRLTLSDHVIDSLGSRFGQISALKVVDVDGHVLVLAAGGDGGLEVLRLLPSGQLVQAAQLVEGEDGGGLQNVTAIEAHVSANTISIFVASEGGAGQDGAGLAHYELRRADLGQVLTAQSARLLGTAGDDLLLDGGQARHLQGAAGADMLVASRAGSQLQGGAGADRFVIQPHQGEIAQGRIEILDFEVGLDQLDLSLVPGLRSLSQLEVRTRGAELSLTFDGLDLRLHSADGTRLQLQDIWPQDMQQAYHIPPGESLSATPVIDPPPPVVGDETLVIGDTGDNLLTGSQAADRIVGAAGNDSLWGAAGADSLLGGDGADMLRGQAGHDRLWGGSGADHLNGDRGRDTLSGNEGADRLYGAAGHDVLWGARGNDRLYGQRGNDRLEGQAGHDSLWGGAGTDRLVGGTGADQLRGQAGNDRLFGGTGRDDLGGGQGQDRLYGQQGADRLNGGAGADLLWGGAEGDVFVFAGRHGQDRIMDFQQGRDVMDLRALAQGGAERVSDLDIRSAQGDLSIDTGSGRILLEDLARLELTAADFIF
ncbi:Ca2+-binding protein, RTX toxin-related [Epibacterium ulvae]|uniref:Ca2+-binding protein, RTX toxin-related n=1 Tax=Epibacterium ulvae TaxID=1156985 RepID=A0A1G5RCY2_9RHOB|nr:calcium-binding protein [Epibacterium ulvae]SCZ71964.1 Ca2+-binding protein, RTX toxin-related [Epibacterium ulvae]